MRSLTNYSLNISEEEYHAYPAWSHSKIVRYANKGFAAIATLDEPIKPSPAMRFGSLFDMMITRPDDVNKHYGVCDVSVPEAELKALDYIRENCHSPHVRLEDIPKEELTKLLDDCQYQSRWGYDARLKHLVPYHEYYDMTRSGVKVVSREDWDDATEMVKVFREDPYLSKLFGTEDKDGIEYIYQSKFVVNYKDMVVGDVVKIKIMPDLIVMDHNNKTIQPVDLKTSENPAYDFADNFVRFRYDIQASMYDDVIRVVKNRDKELAGYRILPYLFTDISRTDKVPVTYVYDSASDDQDGGLAFKGYKYKSWRELLTEILKYRKENPVVPFGIKTNEPNDIVAILNNR